MFSFCKPVSDKKRFLPNRALNDEYSFTLFENAGSLDRETWSRMNVHDNVFLDPAYLSIIEDCFHTRLQCRYVIVYREGRPCGILYFQVIDFKAGLFGSLLSNQVKSIADRKNLFERYLDSNSEEILLRLFTCGNNLVSGDHGFSFDAHVSAATSAELLLTIIDLVAREEKLRGTISAILLKDFYKPLEPAKTFEREGYSMFSVEPNMVVDIPPSVKTLEDYITLFSKKYRSRARSVSKRLEGVESREMSAGEIGVLEKEIYQLYAGVFRRAKFRLMQLPLTYFSEVKAKFPDRFFVHGYWLQGQLVAFSSCFVMTDKSLEAHYIGFDYKANEEHELYQNILYAMIAAGIRHGCTKVNLGRTAAEIKTTVGARPKDLLCYIKPQNTLSRLIQKPFISFLQPQPWTPRNPFRDPAQGEGAST